MPGMKLNSDLHTATEQRPEPDGRPTETADHSADPAVRGGLSRPELRRGAGGGGAPLAAAGNCNTADASGQVVAALGRKADKVGRKWLLPWITSHNVDGR